MKVVEMIPIVRSLDLWKNFVRLWLGVAGATMLVKRDGIELPIAFRFAHPPRDEVPCRFHAYPNVGWTALRTVLPGGRRCMFEEGHDGAHKPEGLL